MLMFKSNCVCLGMGEFPQMCRSPQGLGTFPDVPLATFNKDLRIPGDLLYSSQLEEEKNTEDQEGRLS